MKSEEVCLKKTKMVVVYHDEDAKDCFLEAKGGASALLVTPTPERNTEKALVSSGSPLTWADQETALEDSAAADLDLSPRTPRAAVFDPFAPGPDDLILAPQVKKFTVKSKIDVVRRLNFDAIEERDDVQEDALLGKMYEFLLEAIVSKEIEGVLGEGLIEKEIECCDTPTTMPLLDGVAETCPGAPRKTRSGLKKMDLGLCRKLQF